MFLNSEQLSELTGKSQASKQVSELEFLGIPHLVRSDGRPVVAVEAVRGGVIRHAHQT